MISSQTPSAISLISPRHVSSSPLPTQNSLSPHGFGHLVGMSQYGANAMAEKGSDYRAILTHYFTDTKLQKSTELAQLQ